MKYLASIILLIAFLIAGIQAQTRLNLQTKPVKDDYLAKILNLSEMRKLNPPHPTEHNFFLRLYSLDDISSSIIFNDDPGGNCAPEVETEVTCGFRYFLAVHNGDLAVSGAVYDLGLVGEITKIKWLKSLKPGSDGVRFDRLSVEVTNYPAHAFKLNPKLIRKTKSFELRVNLKTLKISEKKGFGFSLRSKFEKECGRPGSESKLFNTREGKVTKIIAGNMVFFEQTVVNGNSEKGYFIIRLVGIDPNTNGNNLEKFLRENILNRQVTVRGGSLGDTDNFFSGSILRNRLGDINLYLLKKGIAGFLDDKSYSIPDHNLCAYQQEAKIAKTKKLGIWAK